VERPDEISVTTAAALIGVTPRRLRQLADEGFITIHRRGHTSVSSAVSGYVKALRADASRSEVNAAAARAHAAKAGLIRAATDRRKAGLTVRAEAESVINEVAAAAVRRLRDARLPVGIAPAAGKSFASEVAQACARITEARDVALEALRTGDMDLLDGGRDG
jgi:hypothetical protein